MEFPPEWLIFPNDDFDIAAPRDPGRCGVELMAQVWPNGRIMDHFRLAVGRTQLLENSFITSELYANQAIPDMTIKWDVWLRDVKIRWNMSTSEWFDLTELIRSNDARVVENRDQAPGGSAEPVVDHKRSCWPSWTTFRSAASVELLSSGWWGSALAITWSWICKACRPQLLFSTGSPLFAGKLILFLLTLHAVKHVFHASQGFHAQS